MPVSMSVCSSSKCGHEEENTMHGCSLAQHFVHILTFYPLLISYMYCHIDYIFLQVATPVVVFLNCNCMWYI